MSQVEKRVRIGVPREVFEGERRVAIVPGSVPALGKLGADVVVEGGAGVEAGFVDEEYRKMGAEVVDDLWGLHSPVEIVVMVRAAGAAGNNFDATAQRLPRGLVLIACCDPLHKPRALQPLAQRNITTFALEMIPRITRAQSMDVLSSMSTLAGYKSVIDAAARLPRIFPMLMTAAGTVMPARVLVIGAGVAGLQAVATAKRLGAVVHAYDLRHAVKEQVESVGGRFVGIDLGVRNAEQSGGYAKELDADALSQQQRALSPIVAESDVVIATAAVPGKRAPVLLTKEMIHAMRPGSVVVDLAAERGGNCELCKPGQTIDERGVVIMGPLNLASSVPAHASEMFSRNICSFLGLVVKDGKVVDQFEDEILRACLATHGGRISGDDLRELHMRSPAPTKP